METRSILKYKLNLAAQMETKDLDRQIRNQRLRLAVATSLASKISTFALQLVTIYVAGQVIGLSGYATYASVVALSTMPFVFSPRFGPDVVAMLGAAISRGEVPRIRSILWSLFTLTASINAVLLLISLMAFWVIHWSRLPSLSFSNDQVVAISILCLLNALVMTSLALETCQQAYQESYWLNIRTMVGNSVAIVGLTSLLRLQGSLYHIICWVAFPILICQLLNGFLFLRRHPELMPSFNDVSLRLGFDLGMIGFWFSLAAGIGAYLSHQAPILFANAFLESHQVVYVACGLQLTLQVFSMASIITAPIVPALIDSIARADTTWLLKTTNLLFGLLTLFGLVGFVAMLLLGDRIFEILVGRSLALSQLEVLGVGLYLSVISLENYLFTLMCSLGKTYRAYSHFITRSFISATCAAFACYWAWPAGIFLGAFLAATLTTTIPFVLWCRRLVREVVSRELGN